MKKILVKVPEAKSEWLSQFIGENQFVNLLSWVKFTGLFNDEANIMCWIAFPEASTDKITANLKEYQSK